MSKTKRREGEINARWSEAVIAAAIDIDWDDYPVQYTIAVADQFFVDWDKFTYRIWTELVKIEEDALLREAYNHYMVAMATNTWQATNDCWSDPPAECIIQFGDLEEVYEGLVGKSRLHPVWIDQLSWTCEFMKIPMF